ncbi:ATP-binding cassette domain-containing protein [Mucilaginibacter psychrotolerans]|uniref:ATP-binding cassette domain-containing protein n=1 Tax=Mucilaginibacter psychrotolerans TaxID=1524096 RepID=A0A4Y8S3Q1_9SPHI|nr:ATP-binding cassette domain-containing protein [Mucilaginibacter psychrotolerans]TFF33572.1 ATP-binding cassette domain-containing protein [Mucilaginibacter psychrotolerans]
MNKTLKVDSVQLEFDGRKILQSVYLNCTQGEVIGLLGRNGCGKSSLLKIIFGTRQANYRYVSIDEQFIHKGYHNNRIAYLPQHNYLPGGIKIEQLARVLVDPISWQEFAELAIYQRNANKKIHELSGGELRQLETLMIIHSRADFILLDEPFTHISPIQADEFKPVIRACAKRKGIIVTDHQYYNILAVSDKVILLADGVTKHIADNDELITYGYLSGK